MILINRSIKLQILSRINKHSQTYFFISLLSISSLFLIGCDNNTSTSAKPTKQQAPVAPKPKKSPRQEFLDLSHVRLTLETMHDQHFLNYFRLETPQPQLPGPLVPEVRNFIIENVVQSTLLDRYNKEFTRHVTDQDIVQMNHWLASRVGKKIAALEVQRITRPGLTLKKVKIHDLPAKRQKLLSEYVDNHKFTHLTITILKLTKLAILEGIELITGQRPQTQAPQITSYEQNMLREEILNRYATLFAQLSDEELQIAVNVSHRPAYQKVHLAQHRAYIVAFSHTARGIGRILGEGSAYYPQPQENTEQNSEKNEPNQPIGPDNPPDVRKGRIFTYPIENSENLGY